MEKKNKKKDSIECENEISFSVQDFLEQENHSFGRLFSQEMVLKVDMKV